MTLCRHILLCLAVVAMLAAPAYLQAQARSWYVLERLAPWPDAAMPSGQAPDTVPTRIVGNHKFIRWSVLSNENPYGFPHSRSTLVGYVQSGPQQSIAYIAPGYRATVGYYCMSADFGYVARIEPTLTLGSDYAIKSLVLQTASMLNWPGGWTLEDYFNYDHASHFDENSSATGTDMTDYNANPNLLELALIELDDGGLYRGGPVLKYITTAGLTGHRHATTWALLNNGVRMENLGTVEASGTYFSFAWQWDLSDIPGTIATAEISAPLIVHSSTIGVQIDVSDTYNDVLVTFAPPPPSQFVATPGDSSVLLTWQARTNATGYQVKRSTTDNGPYALIATVSDGSTHYRDTGLTNGTTYYYVVSAYNAESGAGADSTQRGATPVVPAIDAWRQTHFGTAANEGDAADDADPDGDGLPNLLEYALRRDPLAPDSAGAVTLGQSSSATKRLALTFARRADAGLVYTVEATDDLAGGVWERVFFSTGIADSTGYAAGTSGVNSVIGNADDTYEAWDNVIISARARRFLRLTVSTGSTTVKDAPRGFHKIEINPSGYTFLGFPLARPSAWEGRATAADSTTLTASGAGWTSGAFANTPHYLLVVEGDYAGLTLDVTGNTADTLTLAQQVSGLVSIGDAVAIIPHATLVSLFGSTNEIGFTTGATLAAADEIAIHDTASQGFLTYYYKTGGIGGTGWRRSTSASENAAGTIIRPGQSISILRKQDTGLSFRLEGRVRVNDWISTIQPGMNWTANDIPVATTLGALGLYTGNALTGLVGGTTSTQADEVLLWNGSFWETFYYKTGGIGGAGWRSTASSSVNRADRLIQPGEAIILRRKHASALPYLNAGYSE